ncbi:MAG: EamA family transporter RarD [Dehalococcoidia bacterium]
MTIDRRGFLYGLGAYLLWGLFPLYWPLLEPAGATEILAHRIVWSLGFVALLLTTRRQSSGWLRHVATQPRTLVTLALAAVIIAVNWLTYIWGVNNGHVVETSLGYFINPLVTVLFGVLIFAERLRRPQWTAVGIAAVAVVILTVDYGRLPWIALTLAISFASYGVLKKTSGVGAVEGLTVETAVLVLPALGFLLVSEAGGSGTFGHAGTLNALLLAGTGVVTAVPLLLFAGAAQRIPLSMIGILQYLAPTLQFLFGVLVFHEPVPPVRLAGFALVWVALVIFTVDGITHHRRQLRLAVEAVT